MGKGERQDQAPHRASARSGELAPRRLKSSLLSRPRRPLLVTLERLPPFHPAAGSTSAASSELSWAMRRSSSAIMISPRATEVAARPVAHRTRYSTGRRLGGVPDFGAPVFVDGVPRLGGEVHPIDVPAAGGEVVDHGP